MYSISIGGDIDKVKNLDKNVSDSVKLILRKASLIVQNNAKENAPVDTGTLRKSITTNLNQINRWFVIVWSPVKYARRREFENNLHPQTKYYLIRWYEEHIPEIRDIIDRYLHEWLE